MEDRITELHRVVRAIPPGQVTTYGAIGRAIGTSPRAVGRLMGSHGHDLPWWRVVGASGHPPAHKRDAARTHLLAEGTPLRDATPEGCRVDMRAATWWELR